MSTTTETRTAFWANHFTELSHAETGSARLSSSSQALVLQNIAYMLEACGEVNGKQILDVGFGNGDLARIVSILGGKVTAIDVVRQQIAKLRELAPDVAWFQGDITTWKRPHSVPPFDVILACETLQYVDFTAAINRLFEMLSEFGRLIVLIPNSDCTVVRSVSERLAHKYAGISMNRIHRRLSAFATDHHVTFRGLYFENDQTLFPYKTDPWQRVSSRRKEPNFDKHHGNNDVTSSKEGEVANRIQIVIAKSPGDETATSPNSEKTRVIHRRD